jgi:hypothetical protein
MFFEENDRSRGELLTDRSGLENAVRGHRYSVLEICKTVSLCRHDLAILDDSEGHSGNFLP